MGKTPAVDKTSSVTKARPPKGKIRRWVRRRAIIDPSLQYRMLEPFALFAVIFVLLVEAFVFHPLVLIASTYPDRVLQAVLQELIFSLHIRIWVVSAVALAIACAYTLVRSNRVAGPLFKLRRGLLKLLAGEYETMRFRKGDQLREFEEVANKLARKFDFLTAGNLRKMAALERHIKFLKGQLEGMDLPKKEIINELNVILTEFDAVQFLGSER